MKPFDEHGAFRPTAAGHALKRLAVRSAGVTVATQTLLFAIQLIATIVLARLLRPSDFGLLTIATTFSLLLMNCGLNGFTEAVIQKECLDARLSTNVFWLNAALGLGLAGAFATAGPVLARVYGEPRLAPVVAAMSSTIFLTSLSVQHLALLKRAMRFSVVSATDIAGRVASVAISIVLALSGWGYWALVAGTIACSLTTTIGAWVLCRWMPGLPTRDAGTRSIIRFAINTYGRFMTNYFTVNLDNLLVGWRFGPASLGIYKKAYDLFVLPLNQLSAPLTSVAVSALSRMAHDEEQYRRYFLNALSTLAFIGMGLGGCLTLIGNDSVRLLLGPQWKESGRLFTFFGPGIGVMLLYATNGWIHLSVGRPDRWLRWGLVELGVTGLLFALALPYGPAGIATAWVTSYWIMTFPALWYAGRPVHLGLVVLVQAAGRYVVASASAGAVTILIMRELGFSAAADTPIAALSRIVAISSLFVAAYVAAVIILHGDLSPLSRVARLLKDILPGRRISIATAGRGCVIAGLLVLGIPSFGHAQVRFVQAASSSQFASGPTTTVSLSRVVTTGDLIAVYVAWTNATDSLISVTDSLGNSYVLVQNSVSVGGGRAAAAYARNVAGGPCDITVTFAPGSFAARTVIVRELSGADLNAPLDGAVARGQSDPGLGVDAITSGAMTTASAGDYIFAATSDQGQASSIGPGTAYGAGESSIVPVGVRAEDRIQGAPGSIAATFTNLNSPFADFVTVMMAFKPAAVPDTTPPSVSIAGLSDSATVSGTTTLVAAAADDVGVAGVQFKVDGIDLGMEAVSPPYAASWNTSGAADDIHTVTAVARDAAGNVRTSPSVSVRVRNIGPSQAIIGADRRVEWSQAGIPGGYPHRTGICATLDPGATSADVNAAIASCNDGVVYLNPGTYTLANGVTFGGRSNVTLRGAGPDRTTLVFSGSDACSGTAANVCVHGSSTVWSGNVPAANVRNWVGGYAKGSTVMTVDSAAGLRAGTVLVLDQLDDVVDTGGVLVSDASLFAIEGGAPGRPNRAQQQFVEVVAINGNQVTISPGIHMSNWRASQQPQAWWWGDRVATATMDGIEDLTIDHTTAPEIAGIVFSNAYMGWVSNVRSVQANRNHVWLFQAARIEIRDSYFHGNRIEASQSYGVELFTTSDDVIVNNIFHHITTPVMTGPSTGSVVAYNFMTDMAYYSPSWMMAGLVGSHDAGTAMNLFEGNAGNQFLMDAYHGTGNLTTLFRNQLTGTEPGKNQGNTIPVNIWSYNRLVNVVGNVLGTPGYHTVYENSASGTRGFAERSTFVLGYAGVLETMVGGLSYDPLVSATLLRWGNFDYATSQTHWNPAEIGTDPAPPDHALPPSFFLFSKPSWWGTISWPAIGPDVTDGQDAARHVHKIPAQVCYDSTPKDSDGILMFNAHNCYLTPQP